MDNGTSTCRGTNTVGSLEIIESVLSETDYNNLFSIATGDEISWHFYPMYHNLELEENPNGSTHGFMHNFFDKQKISSEYIYLINPIMEKIQSHFGKSTTAIRVKMNMTMNIGKQVEHYPHVDRGDLSVYGSRWKTAIYYLDDSDGDTLFFDDEENIIHRQTPKANTLVVFDGNTYHAPQLPLVANRRIVININVLLG
jgi:hypothetical protein